MPCKPLILVTIPALPDILSRSSRNMPLRKPCLQLAPFDHSDSEHSSALLAGATTLDPITQPEIATRHDLSRESASCNSMSLLSKQLNTGSARMSNGRSIGRKVSFRPEAEMLTPPAELDGLDWNVNPSLSKMTAAPTSELPKGASHISPGESQEIESLVQRPTVSSVPARIKEDALAWSDSALQHIISCISTAGTNSSSLKVLSQALPSPSVPGHVFPNVINAIQMRLPPSPMTWINLLHAVPGRFNLADLQPCTPPATPGAPIGGDDYFTTKIFDSAVPAVDYESELVPTRPHIHNLAAPGSVNLIISERYIPPTSANELSDLFNLKGSSMLLDRMTELSLDSGCLLFIYPTKKGGQTFADSYLGPVLDPMLRSMVVMNNLCSNFSRTVGSIPSLDRLLDYSSMRNNIELLCSEMSTDSPSTMNRLHGLRSRFSLEYSGKHNVRIERKIWSDWWVKQEKPRVRSTIANYFRTSQVALLEDAAQAETRRTGLVQEVLDGVATRPASEPESKIELGVFVIKRQKGKEE